MRRYQLGLLIALSLGITGCQSSNATSSWSPSTWSWNPWASKDAAVAQNGDPKPALPSTEANKSLAATSVASRTPAGPISYPTTGAPPANYGATPPPATGYNPNAYAQVGGYPAQPAGGNNAQPAGGNNAQPAVGNNVQPFGGNAAHPVSTAYGAPPAYNTAPAGGASPNTTVPAGYTENGFGGYGQPAGAAPTHPAVPTSYGAPNGYAPQGGVAPSYNTVPSAYGAQPNPGVNPYAQPPAQPGATPAYGQGAALNPSSAFNSGAFAGISTGNPAIAAPPARNTAPYLPGSTKPMGGTDSTIVQAGFDARPNGGAAKYSVDPAHTTTAAGGEGSAPANVTCENGICYPNGSTTTSTTASAGYQQPAVGQPNNGYGSAPAFGAPAATAQPGGSFYR